jgi:glycosyltransferase involved in cell wall biosynthesis
MQPRAVTFVIATYKRVDALKCTLQSVQLQNHQDWTAIVIGDCCGEETYEMIRSLGESRISYYNLPERFGEQSGPNSVGLALAKGDFISFLNHDDLLLRDHLDYALDQLTTCGSDFFIGESANATLLQVHDNGTVVPIFTDIIPAKKDMSSLIHPNPYIFDPSSFWLVRSPYARAVGPWRPAMDLWRTPLRDWIMRAWRLGGKFSFGNRITGLRFWTQNLRNGAPLYSSTTPEHDYMIDRFMAESPEEIRRFLHRQIEEASKENLCTPEERDRARLPFQPIQGKKYLRKILANGYLWLGIDPVNLMNQLFSRPKGGLLTHITQRRTGEDLTKMKNFSDLLRDPEAYRLL